ncbi:hypothetical protein, partial [Stenotrophomonas maltophilia]
VGGGTAGNLDNRGLRPVVRADGTPIRAGDWIAGQVVLFLDDGSNLQLAGVLTSNQPASSTASFTMPGAGTWTVPAGVTAIKR